MYTDASNTTDSNTLLKRYHYLAMRYQTYLDRLNGQRMVRWLIFAFLLSVYLLRVLYWNGWYIVTYALGIYYLNLFIAFLSPQVDPELEDDFDSYEDALPSTSGSSGKGFNRSLFGNGSSRAANSDEEFRPFIRRLPEFNFWYSCTKAIVIALFFTTSRAFDIPVYYPILLGYFIVLFILTMRKQIQHMIRYKYVPFTIGKKTYKPSATSATANGVYSTLSKLSTSSGTGIASTAAVSTAYQAPKPYQAPKQVYQPSGPFVNASAPPTGEFRQVSLSPPPTTMVPNTVLSSSPPPMTSSPPPSLSKTGKRD